jgi:hypothetical protein
MVWLVEKKIFRHILDLGFERVEIPIRVKFEFEVVEGAIVPNTLTKEILYNQDAILKYYPQITHSFLEKSIEETVEGGIMKYLRQCGLLSDKSHDAI